MMSDDQMASHLSHGRQVKPWPGMSQFASTLADSYVRASSTSSAAAAEQAAYRKSMKYADLSASFQFQPIAVETLRPINDSVTDFLDRLGQMISARTNKF